MTRDQKYVDTCKSHSKLYLYDIYIYIWEGFPQNLGSWLWGFTPIHPKELVSLSDEARLFQTLLFQFILKVLDESEVRVCQ